MLEAQDLESCGKPVSSTPPNKSLSCFMFSSEKKSTVLAQGSPFVIQISDKYKLPQFLLRHKVPIL